MSLIETRSRIARAADAHERDVADISLVAVSKLQPLDRIEAVLGQGHRVFGENRLQEAQGKCPALRERFPDIVLPRRDDICYATQNRQDAVKALAEEAQLVLVVGAPASSNSNRLVEVAERRGATSYLVADARDIDPAWLEGVDCVGVTAGASTPEVLVEGVVERLMALSGEGARVDTLPEVDEGMHFKLPPELRD